ncbi:roadblock/LC7 domain-containing protein [Psychromonas sp. SP041]|uniref:roadblock/LC7 domain-containing protein n=1 Tax=Psychromonas sp. SP041 TaxID=1365007 RepID=UPI000401D80B|nr:roadblock/LC7 domain-containing protein [Psychromonas sp. SP041]
MADIQKSLEELLDINGSIAACIVDSNSGMVLGKLGDSMDLDLAAAVNTEVVSAKKRAIKELKLDDTIEDILITLTKQYHIICPVKSNSDLFIYLVLNKSVANLALARLKVNSIESILTI